MTYPSKYLNPWGRHGYSMKKIQTENRLTLRDITPGHQACVTGFSSRISSEKRALLRAYGVVPGYQIRVTQHSPVSVIQVEHT